MINLDQGRGEVACNIRLLAFVIDSAYSPHQRKLKIFPFRKNKGGKNKGVRNLWEKQRCQESLTSSLTKSPDTFDFPIYGPNAALLCL